MSYAKTLLLGLCKMILEWMLVGICVLCIIQPIGIIPNFKMIFTWAVSIWGATQLLKWVIGEVKETIVDD